MGIHFVHTTTWLPVDDELAETCARIVQPPFGNLRLHRRIRYHDDLEIFLVNDKDLDTNQAAELREWPESEKSDEGRDDYLPHPDVLGCYFPHHPEQHRRLIMLSPEKIMQASVRLRDRLTPTQPLRLIYPAIFSLVAAHEIAHARMDGESGHDGFVPWSWLADRFDEGDRDRVTIPSGGRDRCIDCHVRSDHDIAPACEWPMHVVEESLANALALRQNFTADEQTVVEAFVEGQSPAYRAALNWDNDYTLIRETARSWCRFKRSSEMRRWKRVYEEGITTPLKTLTDRLLDTNGGRITLPIDFKTEFHAHLAKRLPDWQAEYQRVGPVPRTRGDFADFLNGVFGVYWELTESRTTTPDMRLAWLLQWSQNGSMEGTDRYYAALGERHRDAGEFDQAIACQQARRTNFATLETNAYWRERHLAGVDQTIAAIEALRCVPASQAAILRKPPRGIAAASPAPRHKRRSASRAPVAEAQ